MEIKKMMSDSSEKKFRLSRCGSFGEKDFRVRAWSETGGENEQNAEAKAAQEISLWHDIELYVNKEAGVVNYVCEIPKGTRDKFEIDTKDVKNPIRQDLDKHGNLRQYKRGDVFFNYGAMPRTWEDPDHMLDVGLEKKVGGDNDPLDVCEIGLKKGHVGEIKAVKVLGVLCMIDDGEADWKVICIDVEDRWAPEINNIADVEEHLPGVLEDIRNWWRVYKVAEGKAENKFGFGEKFLDRKFALDIIEETHEHWMRLCRKVILDRKPSDLYVDCKDMESIHGGSVKGGSVQGDQTENSPSPSEFETTANSEDIADAPRGVKRPSPSKDRK